MMRNRYISETALIETTVSEIGARLPRGWILRIRERNAAVGSLKRQSLRIDAILELRDPYGVSSEIIVEVKTNPAESWQLGRLEFVLKEARNARHEKLGEIGVRPVLMLVSAYLSPLARERLTKAGISYADSTGNISLTIDRPAVYIETQGAEKNPFRVDRPLRSLKGGRAGRVVRGLLDYQTPFGTRELGRRGRQFSSDGL